VPTQTKSVKVPPVSMPTRVDTAGIVARLGGRKKKRPARSGPLRTTRLPSSSRHVFGNTWNKRRANRNN
jgi:hypothetical protein